VPTYARPAASATGTSQAHRRDAHAASVAPQDLLRRASPSAGYGDRERVDRLHRRGAVATSVAGHGLASGESLTSYRPCRRARLSDSVGTCPAEGIPIVPGCAFRPSRTVGALLPSLSTLSLARARGHPRRRPTANGETTHENQGNPEQRRFRRPRGHGPCHSRSRGRGRKRRRVHRRDAAKAKRALPPRSAAGPRPAHSALPRPATWSSLPCRTGHARCARAASPQVSSSLPPYKSNEGCTT
jgi:hypothetical protein